MAFGTKDSADMLPWLHESSITLVLRWLIQIESMMMVSYHRYIYYLRLLMKLNMMEALARSV